MQPFGGVRGDERDPQARAGARDVDQQPRPPLAHPGKHGLVEHVRDRAIDRVLVGCVELDDRQCRP
jgi:hypothetical protein